MTAPKKRGHRNQQKIRSAKLRPKVVKLYLEGVTQKEIGKQVGLSQPSISKLIQASLRNWQETELANVEQYVRDELERLAIIEARAWEGWERSCEDAVRVTTKAVEVDPKDKEAAKIPAIERTTTREGQAGDARFLEVALKCVAKRCDLLGLNAPKEQINYEGGSIQIVEDSNWYDNAERLQNAGVNLGVQVKVGVASHSLSNDTASNTNQTNDSPAEAACAPDTDPGLAGPL